MYVSTPAALLWVMYIKSNQHCTAWRWQLFNREDKSNAEVGVPCISPLSVVRERQADRAKKGRCNEEEKWEAAKRNGRAVLSASAATAAAAACIDADLSSISVRTASIGEIDGRSRRWPRYLGASHHSAHLSFHDLLHAIQLCRGGRAGRSTTPHGGNFRNPRPQEMILNLCRRVAKRRGAALRGTAGSEESAGGGGGSKWVRQSG